MAGFSAAHRSGGETREFLVSRAARDRYRLDESMFSSTGTVVLADFRAARELAHAINASRSSQPPITAGELNALALIHEVMHLLVLRYLRQTDSGILGAALRVLEERFGYEPVTAMLVTCVDQFPPAAVRRGDQTPADYVGDVTDDRSHRETVLEELLLLWLANANPAAAALRELFDDSRLRDETPYLECIAELRRFFDRGPRMPGSDGGLFDLLEAPILAAPGSLHEQLAFLRRVWGRVIGPELDRLLIGLDLLAEERRPVFGPGPGPVEIPTFAGLDDEYEAYSHDLEWMPRLVMMAKNAYVWLDQLSRTHGRHISTLDDIPDGELDRLATWGITGLWLIGVWERSRASARIKRLMGDHDAVASAYSLLDYRIADDLGGERAYLELRDRAWQRGIRLATDMVPNHVGIDSRWVIEHPDWFIGLDHPPFPGYSFTGEDLCEDDRVGIYIEDRYWDRSDAAVVFRRVDHWTGDERFIYHGNDGTSMPWNDTAQLDYRNPEVREAVINTILHVARLSPIIRFDAAMTLTKRHYHRLWFPEPGSGGDIPSRAGHGMTRGDFDRVMPQEFWREVVDRVAAEAPGTLLLAEAFWLLEGYFVRTLGMHRVYNSAFMNMLRDERNAEYRELIKSTLEFDPQILKRYVNFMSNPDERTAVDQFGTGDKYFGVATLMATLPGLPMFGHGQVEGLAEKYGMEFRRPRWEEHPNEGLVRRHRHQLFPLLHRRHLFADVGSFLLYDFYRSDGSVDENVFAYSNRHRQERSLVLYHNRYATTRGWIRTSAAVADGEGVVQRSLGQGLGIDPDPERFVIFRDVVTDLEYLRPCSQLHGDGLYVELDGYQLHVFVDFRDVADDGERRYRELHHRLGGRGVLSVADALAELELAPLLDPYRQLIESQALDRPPGFWSQSSPEDERRAALDEIAAASAAIAAAAARWNPVTPDEQPASPAVDDRMRSILTLVGAADTRDLDEENHRRRFGFWQDLVAGQPAIWAALSAWAVTRRLDEELEGKADAGLQTTRFDELHLANVLERTLLERGVSASAASALVGGVRLMLIGRGWYRVEDQPRRRLRAFFEALLKLEMARDDLGVNTWDGVVWFRDESFDDAVGWLWFTAALESGGDPAAVASAESLIEILTEAKEMSGCRVDRLLGALDRRGD